MGNIVEIAENFCLSLTGNLFNFLYWKTGFAGSPVPRVLLKYRNGRDRPDPKLMREPPMALATLKKLAEEIKTSDRWDKNEDAPLPPRL